MAYVSNVILQTGNGQNFLTWNIVAGATNYVVQRGTDGVNFSNLATPATNSYLDPAVSIGSTYFYRVGATAPIAPTQYTPSQPNSITPCAPGQINLGYLRYQSRLRSDMKNSNFVTNDEWNIEINQSCAELYGLLVSKYGEDYFLAPLQVFSSNGQQFYPLPDGTNYLNTNGMPDPNGKPAPACYKVHKMELNSFGAQVNNALGWVPMSRCNASDLDKYNLLLGASSNNVSGQYCQFQYREMGTNICIIPINSGQYMRLWYVPIAAQLLQDSDMMPYSYSGWHEYVVVDVAAKSLEKQQKFDQANALLARKDALMVRIETEAANRNVGQPNTATNSRSMYGDPNFGGGMFGNGFGWGNGGGYGY
jgi:hypothetical protein